MKHKWILNLLLAISLTAFCISGFLLIRYFYNSKVQTDQFDALAEIVDSALETQPSAPPVQPSSPGETQPEISPYLTVTNPETGESQQVWPEYAELYQMNPDMIGWMHIEGTTINYPVMHTPGRADFYLHRDFNREESTHGCFYVREICDVNKPSDNLVVYGHRMRDGSMMAPLKNYIQKAFWEDHPIVRFHTLTDRRQYEIFSVFITNATEGQGFAYHTFIDAENEKQYKAFVDACKELSFYDTGITPQYGDKLITLSTCDYSVPNGRLVVVARQLSNP